MILLQITLINLNVGSIVTFFFLFLIQTSRSIQRTSLNKVNMPPSTIAVLARSNVVLGEEMLIQFY